jgi:hypothetical protein
MPCDVSQTYLNMIMHDVLDECRHTSLLYRFAHGYTSHATLRQRIRVDNLTMKWFDEEHLHLWTEWHYDKIVYLHVEEHILFPHMEMYILMIINMCFYHYMLQYDIRTCPWHYFCWKKYLSNFILNYLCNVVMVVKSCLKILHNLCFTADAALFRGGDVSHTYLPIYDVIY